MGRREEHALKQLLRITILLIGLIWILAWAAAGRFDDTPNTQDGSESPLPRGEIAAPGERDSAKTLRVQIQGEVQEMDMGTYLLGVLRAEMPASFEEEARKLEGIEFLAQGTIWPDILESEEGIKAHHNAGGLPEDMDFELVEPVRILFKDEVRVVGDELGLPHDMVYRQPFPGPGLGVRIIGEVTAEKVRIVQDADAIYREEIENAGLDKTIGQYFAALTNMRSVGVMGDERTYDYAVALRAVNTVDFMTAEAAEIPYEVLNKVMSRVINEVRGVNRIFYDLTSKPPGTIEFE